MAWQIERGAGGCSSFEELNSIVFALSAFSWEDFQSSNLLCQICRFGECPWCRHNVLDYMICAVECHQQKNWCGLEGLNRICERGCVSAQRGLGLELTLVKPHNQAGIAWS